MKYIISIEYKTSWGEEIVLKTGKKVFPMKYGAGGVWTVVLSGKELRRGTKYSFAVMKDGVVVRREWRSREFILPHGIPSGSEVRVKDSWMDRPRNSAFWSSAFKDAIFSRGKSLEKDMKGNVLLEVLAPEVRQDRTVAITGSCPALGGWKKAVPMDDSAFPRWKASLDVSQPFEYKFVIADRKTLEPVVWEEGENRIFHDIPGEEEALVVRSNRMDKKIIWQFKER